MQTIGDIKSIYFVLGVLIALTLFLSGEQCDRSGQAHLPAILWLLAVTGWLILYRGQPIQCRRVDWGVYGFFGLVILSLLWNLLPGQGGAPRPSLNMLSVWILFAAAWFLFRQTFSDRRQIAPTLALVLAIMLAQSLLGLYQQFVDIPDMIRQFEQNPTGTMAQFDPTIERGSPNWLRLESRLRTAAPMGTYPMSNTLGGLLACCLVLLVGITLFQQNTFFHEKHGEHGNKGEIQAKLPCFLCFPWIKIVKVILLQVRSGLLLATTAVIFYCFLLTKCRSGYVAMGVGFLILVATRFLCVRWRNCLLIASPFLVIPSSGKAVLAEARKSLGFRLEYWEASLNMIWDYPIFGCGSGNFKQTYMAYKLPHSSEEISDPHNFMVEIAATAGLPAMILLLILLGFVLFRGFWAKSPINTDGHQAVPSTAASPSLLFWGGLLGSWLAFLLSFLSEAPMSMSAPVFATIAFMFIGWILLPPPRNPVAHVPPFENTLSTLHSPPSTLHSPLSTLHCSNRINPFENLPRIVPVAALVTLLVHLLAAGGISVTNTALLLWLLAAVLVGRQEGGSERREAGGRRQEAGCEMRETGGGRKVSPTFKMNPPASGLQPPALIISALLVVVAWGVYVYGASPIMQSQPLFFRAEMEPDFAKRIRLLDQAAWADPWSATIADQMSMVSFQFWRADPRNEQWKKKSLESGMHAVRLMPRSGTLHFAFAERLNMISQLLIRIGADEGPALRDQALDQYRNAIRLYPNQAKFRAAYALLLFQVGRTSEAQQERDLALSLDDHMPHLDQKLPEALREELQK